MGDLQAGRKVARTHKDSQLSFIPSTVSRLDEDGATERFVDEGLWLGHAMASSLGELGKRFGYYRSLAFEGGMGCHCWRKVIYCLGGLFQGCSTILFYFWR